MLKVEGDGLKSKQWTGTRAANSPSPRIVSSCRYIILVIAACYFHLAVDILSKDPWNTNGFLLYNTIRGNGASLKQALVAFFFFFAVLVFLYMSVCACATDVRLSITREFDILG